ncbi:MAG: DUF1214 domain-containing protein [Desulfuromusa sp.]|nr:DUF1214 domain-containing protein [Desulfuromusa sp.]
MKKTMIAAVLLFLALLIGVGSSYSYLKYFHQSGWISNGPWKTNLGMGLADTGMYDRAWTALFSVFSPSNVNVYYKGYTDEDGEKLQASCNYRIEGKEIDSRWWSLTAYMEDGFLIPNEEKRYSWNKYNFQNEGNGQFVINLSKEREEINWIPLGDYTGGLSLTLRLYHPGKAFYENPETVELPKIIKEGCK